MCYRGLRYNYVLIDVVPLWWAQPSGWLNVRLNPDHTVQIVMQMPLDTLLMKPLDFAPMLSKTGYSVYQFVYHESFGRFSGASQNQLLFLPVSWQPA